MLRAFAIVFSLLLLSACGKQDNWPDGMLPIHWDRDTCAHCNMVISDSRFAVELVRPGEAALKFDDIGCLIAWTNAMRQKNGTRPWWEETGTETGTKTRAWVADFNSVADKRETLRWLDARVARYIERTSPMGHNLAAVEKADEKTLAFEQILAQVPSHGQTHRQDSGHSSGHNSGHGVER